MNRIRVLLVDDHKVVRQGIRHLLELDGGIEVVGEAETGEEALAEARSACPDVVLMDIRIPGLDGIEATRRLKQGFPSINVVMLTSYAEECIPAIEAGASGYLLKSVGYDELVQAIRAVHGGEAVIDRSLGREVFRRFGDLVRASKETSMSDRELETLGFLASGMTSKEIASQLYISETTLKRELRHIFTKLGVKNRGQAIAEAFKKRLL